MKAIINNVKFDKMMKIGGCPYLSGIIHHGTYRLLLNMMILLLAG